MPVPDLIELVLLELTDYEMADEPHARPRPADTPRPAARPARVIPIDRARARRCRPVVPRRPAAEDLAALHSRCTQVRALAERARAAAVQARARAQAVLEGRGGED